MYIEECVKHQSGVYLLRRGRVAWENEKWENGCIAFVVGKAQCSAEHAFLS